MRSGVDLSEFDHAFPTDQEFYILRVGHGVTRDMKIELWLRASFAANKPHAAYLYVDHHVPPDAQANFLLTWAPWAPSLMIDVEANTTAAEGRAVIAHLRSDHRLNKRPIIRYSPEGRALSDGDIGQDWDWTALWGSNGRPPRAVPGIPLVAWQDWSSDSGYPRPLHAPIRGDSDLWLDESRFAQAFGQQGSTLMRFVQAYEPEKHIAVPVGTQLFTFDGKPYEPLNGTPGAVVNLATRGLVDAHTGTYCVLVQTGGVYSDGQPRLTELYVVLPGVSPT